jgi:hypothetical protein
MLRSFAIAIVLALGAPSRAQTLPHHCEPIAGIKKEISDAGGQWIDATPEQRDFLKGVYSMWPSTPVGLPIGEKTVIAHKDGRDTTVIIWIDNDQACDLMQIPDELYKMMMDVGEGTVFHDKGGL